MTTSSTQTNNIFLVALLASICALPPLATDMYLPSLPEISTQFATNASSVQLTITAWLIGLAFGQVIAGPISDIYGRSKPLLIGLIIFALSCGLCVITPSIEIFIFARLVGGFSAASALVVSRAIATDICHGTTLTKFLATVMVIQGIAPILAPVIGGQLVRFFPWESNFVILGAFGIIIILMTLGKYRESLPVEKRLKGNFSKIVHVFSSLCSRPSFASLCAVQFFIFCAFFGYISGMPFILQGIYGFSPQEFSLVFAIMGIGLMVIGKTTNILAGRISDAKLLLFALCQGTLFGILFLVGILLNLDVFILLVFLFLSQTSLSMSAATSFSLAMQAQKKVSGSASALLGFFSMISGALVAPIVGIGGGTTAVPTGIVIALCDFLALIVFLVCNKRKVAN